METVASDAYASVRFQAPIYATVKKLEKYRFRGINFWLRGDTFGAGLISINVGRAWRGRGGALGVCVCVFGGGGGLHSRLFGPDAEWASSSSFSDFHLKKIGRASAT